jgi:hypothetical protein
MAPGILCETPNGDEPREKIEVTIINGCNHCVKIEKEGNGDTDKVDDAQPKEKASSEETESDGDSDSDGGSDDDAPVDQTMKCEVKHLDRRFDDKDEIFFAERKEEVEKPKQKDWWRLFAFCLVRYYDSDEELDGTYLYVNPQPLRQLLADVIGNYPGDPIEVDDVKIRAPYHSLFHFRNQLESDGTERFADDPDSLEHLKLLLTWIKTHFEADIAAYDRCISNEHKVITYDQVWTLFPPKTIAYAKLLGQNRAFRVHETYYETSLMSPSFNLRVDFIDFDGDRLGNRRMELSLPKYQGARELHELSTMPLDMLDDVSEVREELLARGRKFESYVGPHFLHYDGIALKKTPEGYARINVKGRVMIDCKTFHRLEPNDSFLCTNNDETGRRDRSRRKAMAHLEFLGDGTKKFDKLSDEDAMLTNATLRGYSFTVKRFLEFFTEDISEIEWNTSCFDDLVLDQAIKKTVQALVSTHSQKRESFDDIVKGKGMGLVCVLHGPPGVGKTLTAECVAEFVKRPLYMVSSGDRKNTSLIPHLSYRTLTYSLSRNQQHRTRPQSHAHYGHDIHLARRPPHR